MGEVIRPDRFDYQPGFDIETQTEPSSPEAGVRVGDGGGGGGMEARVAHLESSVKYIERDVTEVKNGINRIETNQRSDLQKTWIGIAFAFIIGLSALWYVMDKLDSKILNTESSIQTKIADTGARLERKISDLKGWLDNRLNDSLKKTP